MMNEKHGTRILAVCFLVFIFAGCLINCRLMGYPVRQLLSGNSSLSEFPELVAENYRNHVHGKGAFINLNGIYKKALNQHYNNKVYKTYNDLLIEILPRPVDMRYRGEDMTRFAQWVNERETDFMYVQIPYKIDVEGKMVPQGLKDYTNDIGNQVVDVLREHSVPVLDLRPSLVPDPETAAENYFRTDHHWKSPAAFQAYQEILTVLQDRYPQLPILGEETDVSSWELHERKNSFLGSAGKRVGIYYDGIDDFTWYTPKFSTHMTCEIPELDYYEEGTFEETVLHQELTETSNYFEDNPYCTYIGGDYRLVKHRNEQAPCDLKLLILKDSYTLPLQCFMSTVFQEIDVIDPRASSEQTICSYIEQTDPDMVLVFYNPRAIVEPAFFEFGLE